MFRTPNGSSFALRVRGDTNDGALATGILDTDEYELRGLKLEGWALDIGAHIGTVGIALAIDNPDLKVICVEPVPDNCDLIRDSIRLNGLGERVFVEEASAGAIGQSTRACHYAYTSHTIPDQGYVEQNRYIGNLWREGGEGTVIDSPVVTLAGLADKYGVDDFRFCKSDCEGCEWDFFKDGASTIREIIAEWHDAQFEAVDRLFGSTHYVTMVTDYGGSGIFRAIRKEVW